jgi:TfoX/Sxy family transcriptional regulator of competence genes
VLGALIAIAFLPAQPPLAGAPEASEVPEGGHQIAVGSPVGSFDPLPVAAGSGGAAAGTVSQVGPTAGGCVDAWAIEYRGHGVTYDVQLVDRVRELLADRSTMTEKKMFGGLAFLVAGKMAVAASGQGGLLVRVDPAQAGHLLATTNARPMEMKGRPVRGWLRIDGDDLRTKRHLAKWVAIGARTATSTPTKGWTDDSLRLI